MRGYSAVHGAVGASISAASVSQKSNRMVKAKPSESTVRKDIPGYRIQIEPCPRRVRVVYNGMTVADSSRALVLRETRLMPVYYFPREDVRMDLMQRTEHRTYCPFKGNASYWTLTVGGKTAGNVVWSYEDPLEEAADIEGYVAFCWNKMDAWYEEEERIRLYVPDSPLAHPNPIVGWLLREAWDATSPAELVHRLARCMVEAGIPLCRLHVIIRTLHPQVTGSACLWWRHQDQVEMKELPHSLLESDEYLHSPLVPIFEGAGGIRRRLDIAHPRLDYPILKDLHAEGVTDYVAMPLLFSDGQINVITMASDRPGGFTTEDLGQVYETLPLISRLLEVHAVRRMSVGLLETYLGKHSGRKVLEGRIRRGDGEDIHAVIWFCDLRDSMALANSMSRQGFLEVLNAFFDCMAGAVLDHGGEILRFIGDAALAIFPIPADAAEPVDGATAFACNRALAAANDARHRLEVTNRKRQRLGHRPLSFGLALHVGDVMYGNIGTGGRLEFTVIGAAANAAARMVDLCKTLDRSILVSGEFARFFSSGMVALGPYALRGMAEPQEIFTVHAGK